jgi:hypothetical protein
MSCDSLWKPESIRVFAGEGKTSIEIIGYLKDHTHPHSALMGCRKRLEFPADVYPPNVASKNVIEDAIINAAATVDVHLTKQGTDRKKKLFTTILGCDMRKTYYAPKDSSDIQKKVYKDMDASEQLSVKEGIKHDNFINRRAAQRRNGKNGAKRTYTTKPAPNQTCPFHLRICLDPGKCWYLPPWAGNVNHNHKKLGTSEKRRRLVTLTQREQYEAGVFSRHGSAGQTTGILNELHGNTFSSSQINHNKKKQYIAQGILPPSFSTGEKESDAHLSDATRLIKYLDHKRGEVSYVALYYEVKSTSLHTITKATLRRAREQDGEDDSQVPVECAVIAECVDAAGNATRTNATLSSEEQSQIDHVVCPVLKRLKVGQKILLAVAWVREDEKRLFELFPEVLMVDVTYGTNNEGRPLLVSAAFDKDMKSFTPLRAFLPSECRWVFRWMWGTAIPTLLGRDNLLRVQLVLSDGDMNIYVPFDELRDEFYPHAVHGLCMYHKILQAVTKLRLVNGETEIVKAMVHT